MVLGSGLGAVTWAILAPTSALYLALGALAAGPLAVVYIPWAATAMWKESNGKYVDGVFQKWIKAQVRAARAASRRSNKK